MLRSRALAVFALLLVALPALTILGAAGEACGDECSPDCGDCPTCAQVAHVSPFAEPVTGGTFRLVVVSSAPRPLAAPARAVEHVPLRPA